MSATSANEIVFMMDDEPYRLVSNASLSVTTSSSQSHLLGGRSFVSKSGPIEISSSFDTYLLGVDTLLSKFLNFTPSKIGFAKIGDSVSISVDEAYLSSLSYDFSIGQPAKIAATMVSAKDSQNEIISTISEDLPEIKKTNIASFQVSIGILNPTIKTFRISFSRAVTFLYSCFGRGTFAADDNAPTISAQANIELSQYEWRDLQKKLENEKISISIVVTSIDGEQLLSYSTGENMILTEESISASDTELVNINLGWIGAINA